MPGLGSSLDDLKHAYGAAIRERVESDLYAHSYDFADGQALVTATLLVGRASHLGVFFEEPPAAAVPWLLERYSRTGGWQRAPNTDPRFARHYTPFDPNRQGNQLYVSSSGVALVQRDVGFGKLVLWIEEDAYPELLRERRRARRS